MKSYSKSVENSLLQRKSLIILGLTGRTGSGCSTVSKILSRKSFSDLDIHAPKSFDYSSREERKYEVIYRYMQQNNHWIPFSVIEGSSVILSFIIAAGKNAFREYLNRFKATRKEDGVKISAFDELEKVVDGLSYIFDHAEICMLGNSANLDSILCNRSKTNEYYNYYLKTLPSLKRDFHRALGGFTCHREYTDRLSQSRSAKAQLYTFLMQEIGNNIRSSGNPYSSEYSEENFYDVAKKMDAIISIIQKHNFYEGIATTRICIDAIRNPYEAYYFKDRYSNFYLASVNTDDSARKSRMGILNSEELNSLDETENLMHSRHPYDIFFHQSMQECLSASDIHFYNPDSSDNKYFFLTEQIVKYLSLMLHPGLVTPSHIERCMQTAYVAKLNSGCLSRQVGAVITDQNYSIKAVGWNEVPEGQVSCNLRCIPNYCENKDRNSFSAFELEDRDFQAALEKIDRRIDKGTLQGVPLSYCFKDVYNELKQSKNQVFTRALHAEENAFLQLSKYGGQGIIGGKLFSTASPCELCSKKAYQLGIQDIYYIDPYPGISIHHVLTFGDSGFPAVHPFYGAIGDAYIKLYTPRMALKDELHLRAGIKVKDAIHKEKAKRWGSKDIKIISRKNCFKFNSRSDIHEIVEIEIEALHDGIDSFCQEFSWTGSSIDGVKLNSGGEKGDYVESILENESSCAWTIIFGTPLKKDERITFEVETILKDASHIMNPFYSQLVSYPTESLTIMLEAPINLIDNANFAVYADAEMNDEFQLSCTPLDPNLSPEVACYEAKIESPVFRYTYCVEWQFKR